MTLFKIDGIEFDVIVTGIQRNFNVIEGSNSGTAIHKQRELRDILGVKIGHSVSVAGDENPEEYEALVNYLFGSIRESVMIEVIHNQTHIQYEAAYNTASDSVSHIDHDNDVVYWNELTVDFRPIEMQITKE
jgi:PAS domain-containing protein